MELLQVYSSTGNFHYNHMFQLITIFIDTFVGSSLGSRDAYVAVTRKTKAASRYRPWLYNQLWQFLAISYGGFGCLLPRFQYLASSLFQVYLNNSLVMVYLIKFITKLEFENPVLQDYKQSNLHVIMYKKSNLRVIMFFFGLYFRFNLPMDTTLIGS